RRSLELSFERRDKSGGERDHALPLLGLRLTDAKDPLDETHVLPAEALQLEAADARQLQREEDRSRLLVGERLKHASDLGGLQYAPAATPHLRPLDAFGHVRLDQLLGLGRLQDVMQDRQ